MLGSRAAGGEKREPPSVGAEARVFLVARATAAVTAPARMRGCVTRNVAGGQVAPANASRCPSPKCCDRLVSDCKILGPSPRALACLLSYLTAAGCGSINGATTAPTLSEIGMSPSQQLHELELGGRPPAVLVSRHGDPAGAVAIAFAAPDDGPAQAQAVVDLLAARLEAAGYGPLTASLLSGGGYVAVLAKTPDDTESIIEAIDRALRDVVTGREPWLDDFGRRQQTVRNAVDSAGHAVTSNTCSAAPNPTQASLVASSPRSKAALQRLNAWRSAARQSSRARLAILGGPKHLAAAEGAIESLEPWPAGILPSPTWPKSSGFAVAPASGGPSRLSIAVRLPAAGPTVDVARVLGAPESPLAIQLGALGHGWRIETLSGEAELLGGCLHLELRPDAHHAGVAPTEVARAARLVVAEVERAATLATEKPRASATAILRTEDPRRAAAAAAWRALSRPVDEPLRAGITWQSDEDGDASSQDLERAFGQFDAYWKASSLEAKVRQEPGQGELWVLLASPCGTAAEGRLNAGLGALALSAVARANDGQRGVAFEPWVAADGLGLVAHATRLDDSETPEQLAIRVADALGKALVAREPASRAFLEAQHASMALLGPHPRPGYWSLLDSLAPEHPSWLLPEGTWDTLANADAAHAATRLRMLLSGPLRVASLTNGEASQSEIVEATLARWLRPVRAEPRQCPASPAAPPPRWGLTRLNVAELTEHATHYVGIALPTYDAPLDSEARYTAWLLNRSGGWLDRALARSHLASWAKAHLLGGPKAAALVVELAALPEQRQTAVMQVRALFGRLAAGAVTDSDVAAATRYFEDAELLAALDPRFRIVRLWRRQPETKPKVTLEDLRMFHRQVFAAGRAVVIELAREP